MEMALFVTVSYTRWDDDDVDDDEDDYGDDNDDVDDDEGSYLTSTI